jgi:hypothetical protein
MKSVPDLDKERPYAIPFTRPLPIPHLHDWRKMEVCLINFNKGEGCLKFYNILRWSVTVQGKLQKPGLFGDYMYSASCQYKYESPMTVLEILYTLSGL